MTEAESGSGTERERSLEEALRRERHKRAELEERTARLEAELVRQQGRTAALAKRRSIRWALRLAEFAKPVIRLARKEPQEHDSVTISAADVAAELDNLGPDIGPSTGPLVSIVIVDHDGGFSRSRFLSGLQDATAYTSFEVVLADCFPDRETAQLTEEEWGFPIRVVAGDAAMSFARAANSCLAEARGELLLLVRGGLTPINAGWLGALVDELQSNPTLGAVAPALVDLSPAPEQAIDEAAVVGYDRGAEFRLRRQTPESLPAAVVVPIRATVHSTDTDRAESNPVPALRLGCILARTEIVRDVGGLDEGFTNGMEGVDLSLLLRQAGHDVAVVERAALFRLAEDEDTRRPAQLAADRANAQHFAEKWGPRLSRSLQTGLLTPPDGNGQTVIAITLTRDDSTAGWADWEVAHELGNALRTDGYDVTFAEKQNDRWYEIADSVSAVICLNSDYDVRMAPPGALTMAWIHGESGEWIGKPWFRHFDVYVPGSSATASRLADAGVATTEPLPLATNEQLFFPHPPDSALSNDFAATANYHGRPRYGLEKIIVHASEKFSIYGRGWAGVPKLKRYDRGRLPYEDLPDVYASTRVIIDATAESMRSEGALSATVFDATAAGALVLTNNSIGSDDVFAGELPVYQDERHQRELLDLYLGNETERRRKVEELRRIVLDRHTYRQRAQDIRGAGLAAIALPRIALKIGTPEKTEAPFWGDTHFAEALASSLAREGATPTIQFQSEWELPGSHSVDAVIHLRGLGTYVPKPAHKNILWIISHPDQVSVDECNKYDLVLVASAPFAAELRTRVAVPVEVMHQATRFERFSPEPDPELAAEVLFVGNTRGRPRQAIEHALAIDAPLRVYGRGWEQILPDATWEAEHFPNDRLGVLYASAGVTLNDHWPDMARQGFISNRIFDIVAAGGLVITDPVAGLETVFGDLIPTFDSPEQLQGLLNQIGDDRDGFAERMGRAREIVLQHHTFDARARRIMELIETIEPRQGA